MRDQYNQGNYDSPIVASAGGARYPGGSLEPRATCPYSIATPTELKVPPTDSMTGTSCNIYHIVYSMTMTFVPQHITSFPNMHRIYAHSPAVGASVYPDTTPAIDISRSNLKRLAMWIRDDLDLLVAREGPDVLRPDDVLLLHEAFIALCQSRVTILDLRATGIHRAVQGVTGVATRWPGRLCDDCDKVVSTWTARFGPLNDIRPFLYGRGGRLEGIASATEHSQEVGYHYR